MCVEGECLNDCDFINRDQIHLIAGVIRGSFLFQQKPLLHKHQVKGRLAKVVEIQILTVVLPSNLHSLKHWMDIHQILVLGKRSVTKQKLGVCGY